MNTPRNAVLLDLDGTLVDSIYLHVLTWGQAFREHGFAVPLWRVHAGIGMGSHRLVPWLLGKHVPETEALVTRHRELFSGAGGLASPHAGRAGFAG